MFVATKTYFYFVPRAALQGGVSLRLFGRER